MSAELLHRAAKVLRQHVDAATGPDPWRVDRAQDYWVWLDADGCNGFDTGLAGDSAYIALMHPPVALALADLLDTAAFVAEGNGLVDDDRYKDEYVLARAILRDPS